LGFDEQVHVIALNRVMHDPKAVARTCLTQRHAETAHEAWLAQRRQAAAHTDRHVLRRMRIDRCATPVQHTRSLATRPAGAEAWSATTRVMTRRVERELSDPSCHGERLGPWSKRRCRPTTSPRVRDLAHLPLNVLVGNGRPATGDNDPGDNAAANRLTNQVRHFLRFGGHSELTIQECSDGETRTTDHQ
jgi:hypothetical protein